MTTNATELANKLGLLGLADRVNAGEISVADFEASVTHIEGVLQRDGGRLGKVTIIAKDKEIWENDIRPKLQQAFDYQLQAVACFHEYARQPGEEILVQGINLLGQAADLMRILEGPGAVPTGIQEAIGSALGDSATIEVPKSGKADADLEF